MKSLGRRLFCFLGLAAVILIASSPAFARWWFVYPGPDGEAIRAYIQAVIDGAQDGDVIYFTRGTYDFSGATPFPKHLNSGALVIQDKSLTIKGAPGSVLVGAPVIIDPDSGWMYGINCFLIMNSAANKDITFEGLTFRTFMTGILPLRTNDDPNTPIYYANLRNVAVRNCTFLDIKRNGIACAGVQGNISICNNRIYGDRATSRIGFYADWLYEPGNLEWQPDNTIITIMNNSIAGFNSAGILTNRPSKMQITGNTISDSGAGITFNVGLKNEAIVSNNTLSELDQGINVFSRLELINGVMFETVTRHVKITYNNLRGIRNWGVFFSGGISYSNLVSFNSIDMMNDTEWGPALYSEGHHEQFKHNTITGYGPWGSAIMLGFSDYSAIGGPIDGAHHELFMNNSVSGFNSPGPSYWLDWPTHDNVVIGIPIEHATYEDYGTNNTFKFVYPLYSSSPVRLLASPQSSRASQMLSKRDAMM